MSNNGSAWRSESGGVFFMTKNFLVKFKSYRKHGVGKHGMIIIIETDEFPRT